MTKRSLTAVTRPTAGDSHRAAAPTSDRILTTRVGLQIPEAVTFDGWERAGTHLSRIIDTSSWCLGDWLVFGKRRYQDRYRRAVDAVGLDYQTLRNYAWVAGRFELSRRRESLSFQHHAEVAALPAETQDYWLDVAQEGGWSRSALRRAVRDAARRASAGSASVALPRVLVPQDNVELWRRAARYAERDLGPWVIETLNQAAARALG
ncbi:hypothetical protein Val02_37480 [Virgisporangium aliadipatigenens]|uniref:LmbU n=1 Tax=Virgisporangium aliadipatigenens TaxID=741659 RepID=A0A8J3YM05_9ACTN|nr:LmbU family transcriptional regulator [Virgisporangium aliadipatigenens]GIJ46862.1 hypothetical protein Val02_37480 [Virgisporangium aliadipatigenens]